MLGSDFFEKSDRVFEELFNVANDELGSAGLNVEPSVIVDRVISPLRDLYLRSLAGLLQSLLEKSSRR
jgi:hypothetical protein